MALPLPNLFVVPASGKAARDHIEVTIARPIDTALLRRYLSSDQIKQCSDGERGAFAWGAVPGPDNLKTWEAMAAQDYVIFYQSRAYTFLARVLGKIRDQALAKELWGVDSAGNTWELMFFLSHPVRINKSLDELADFFQSSPYMGFTKVPANRLAGIVEAYGDVSSFVEQRLVNIYLLLRSNPSSPWDDEDAKTYHFGKSVPNYKKIVPGAKFIIDRKTENGLILIGKGEIAGVQALPGSDGDFVASYQDYEHFDPPRILNQQQLHLIAQQPNYNVQHSIRMMTEQAYNALLGHRVPRLPGSTPQELAETIYWDLLAATQLLNMFNRSNQMILAGPPGTGKSFIANRLAELAVRDGVGLIERLQFHPSYQYEDFIEGIRPVLVTGEPEPNDQDTRGQIAYSIHEGILKRLVRLALKNPADVYVLVIDELNRANVSKVFGELLFCLEYRRPEYKVTLPYSNADFYVPPNIKIIATMNTADRSIALIDAAFRRRFHQYTLTPDADVVRKWHDRRGQSAVGQEAALRLERLNAALSEVLDKGRLVGHSFFLREDLGTIGFPAVWSEDLEPILSEYLFNSMNDLDRCRNAYLKSD